MLFGPFPSKPPPHFDAIPSSLQPQCRGCVATYLTLHPIVLAPDKARFFSAVGRMPPLKGSVNYKNDIPINIISEILPNDEYGWQAVSFAYHEQSKEKDPHNTDNLKSHWIKTLCNGMKKPTGNPGGPNDWIHRCISIEKRILDKTHSRMLGLSLDNEDDAPRVSGAGEDDEPFWGGVGGRGGASMSHLNQHKMRMMMGIQMLLLCLAICLLSLVLLALLLSLPPLARCRIQVTMKR